MAATYIAYDSHMCIAYDRQVHSSYTMHCMLTIYKLQHVIGMEKVREQRTCHQNNKERPAVSVGEKQGNMHFALVHSTLRIEKSNRIEICQLETTVIGFLPIPRCLSCCTWHSNHPTQ